MTTRWFNPIASATLAAFTAACLAVGAPAQDTPEAPAEPTTAASDDAGPAPDLTPTHRPIDLSEFNREEPLPLELQDVEVTEHLGEHIPLDLKFVDASGESVELSEYFDGETPVLLNLLYYRCPMSCPVILHNIASTLRDMELEPGADYRVLTVSIDPTDRPSGGREKKRDTLATLDKPGGEQAWAFLTGNNENIKPLAEAVGYGYRYLPGPKQYTHQDVVMVLSPEGKITRYLYGRNTPSMTMQLSLVEASQGKVGSTTDAIRLYCFYYSSTGEYALAARRLMTAGGAVTVLVLGGVLGTIWTREKLRARRRGQDQTSGKEEQAR